MSSARILLLSDEISPAYYGAWNKKSFEGIDLIIGLGDLPASYLSFLADRFNGYVLYVPGNHDRTYQERPPLGCVNIDGKIFVWRGLRILGLGGSMLYNGGPNQYSEKEMEKRVRKLSFALLRAGGFDLLVTHSPAFGHYDGKDPCHTGFMVFNRLISRYKPSYFFHGHIHLNYGDYPRTYTIDETTVINGFQNYIVEIPLPDKH